MSETRDEDFAYFIEEFGEAEVRQQPHLEDIERWRGRLPDRLLQYWQDEGWCAYAKGLFWTVDPQVYEDTVDEWLDGSPLEQIDAYHVIARTAFGELYLCGEKSGCGVHVVPHLNAIFASDVKPKSTARLEQLLPRFFSSMIVSDCEITDDQKQPLFNRALQTLGPLAADEMYGFEPALVAGGSKALSHLRKVKILPHLSILRQMAAPIMPYGIMDIDKLVKDNS